MALSLLQGAGHAHPADTRAARAASATSTGTSGSFPLIVHAGPGARRHRRWTATRSCTRKKALQREGARRSSRTYQQPALVQQLPAGPRVQRRHRSAAASSRSCRWPRSTTRSLPARHPADHVLRRQVGGDLGRVQADPGHLPGPGRRRSWPRVIGDDGAAGPSGPSAAGATAGWTSGSTRTARPASSRSTAIPASTRGMGLARSAEQAGIDYPELLQTHRQGRLRRPALRPAPADLHLEAGWPAARERRGIERQSGRGGPV
ncbi:MAG: hypothetical protein M0C28_47545 [Candidatus Moduliflexus flocculans]|nr:hypothetical protein [Candidatus Moduliflexus flocculans]